MSGKIRYTLSNVLGKMIEEILGALAKVDALFHVLASRAGPSELAQGQKLPTRAGCVFYLAPSSLILLLIGS